MKIIYEKESVKKVEGKNVKEIKKVSKTTATHKHICYHDEENPKPCRREKI